MKDNLQTRSLVLVQYTGLNNAGGLEYSYSTGRGDCSHTRRMHLLIW